MRILALTTRCPFPLHEGRALRTFNLLKQVARKHEVILCTFLQSREEVEGLREMRAFCSEVYGEPLYIDNPRRELLVDLVRDAFSVTPILATKYRKRAMLDRMSALVRERDVDVVHLDMLHLGDFVPAVSIAPTVLVEHNVEAVILARRLQTERNPLRRAYLRYQHAKLERYEARICAAVEEVVTVSDLDAAALRVSCPTGSFTSVSNGVDADYFQSKGTAKKPGSLVFVGGLSWFPNLDAIRYFTAEILPRIAERVPDVSLTVVGRLPSREVAAEFAGDPRVRLTGTVDDVRPFIDEAAAYVVPLRIGGGTRLKILDALAMGQAVVTTSIGCEGLELRSGEHLCVGDDPAAFTELVVRALNDPAFARGIGEAGRARVRSHYDWKSIAQVLERVYLSAVEKRRAVKGIVERQR